jgi:hypothetical protein
MKQVISKVETTLLTTKTFKKMKRFQSLGRSLSKKEQKQIGGGYMQPVDYCCDVTYTDGSVDQKTVSSDTVQHARAYVIQNYSEVWDVKCELAGA